MRTINTIFSLIFILTSMIATGQKDPVLMKVGDKVVTREEFKAIFTKNLKDTVITREALDEYMVLFTKFKLKVTEAEAMGLDTTKKFKDELSGYRKQLARPYLTDVSMSEEMVKEAYDRMLEEVRASHILVKCEMDASPKDTAEAYKKAMSFRDRIMKGEDFAKVAGGKFGSDDPSAAKNGGDIGYFSSLQMVYPFESACYNMKVGDVSKPVRTRFGYHIIKVTDRRPARGQVKVAHILIASRNEDDPKMKEAALLKAKEIKSKIDAGEDFSNLANQYSDDASSSRRGGELTAFGPGKMVDEFENASFALQNVNDVSDIIQTSYGYHIIKLLEKIPVSSFDEVKGQLKQKISRDSRSSIPRIAFIRKLKSKYNYKETKGTLDLFYKGVDSSILEGKWRKEYLYADKSYVRPTNKNSSEVGLIKDMDGEKVVKDGFVDPAREIIPTDKLKEAAMKKKIMFTFADKKYSQYDFAVYLENNQRLSKGMSMDKYIEQSFRTFANDEIVEYEDSRLEELYPEFRLLMKEYRDGILLFELTDQMVWNKAVKDTAGLRAFYNERKDKYMWPVRYDVAIFTCASEEVANGVKADLAAGFIEREKAVAPESKEETEKKKKKKKKKVQGPEMEKLPVTYDLLREKYNKDSQLNLRIELGKFAEGDKEVFPKIDLTKKGVSPIVQKDKLFVIVDIKEILQPMPKTLNEAKGVITADYQSYLEQIWIKELEGKYKVEIFKDVLYSIK